MNSNSPSITVVIPLYNKEKYILRTINSVLNQSFKEFELIVINDGSTDDSLSKLESVHDSRLTIISHNNIGHSATRNKGARIAKTELVAFIDADDSWKPNFLQTIVDLYHQYPEAGIFGTNFIRIDPNGNKVSANIFGINDIKGEHGIIKNFFKMSLYDLCIRPAAFAIKKSIMEETSGFLTGVIYGEDFEFFTRLAFKYPIAYSKKREFEYHTGLTNSITQSSEFFEMPIIDLYIDYKSNADLNEEQEYYLEEYINRLRLDKCFWALIKGHKKLVKKLLNDSKNNNMFKGKWIRYYFLSKIPHRFYMLFRFIKYGMLKR